VDKVSWIDNEVFDDADMFNSNLVERQIHAPTERACKSTSAACSPEADALAAARLIDGDKVVRLELC
jgi:hypothetical protein